VGRPNDHPPRGSSSKTVIQLRKTLLEQLDILRASRLELTQILLVDVRDLSGLDGREKPYQPVSLLTPILAHYDLHDRESGIS